MGKGVLIFFLRRDVMIAQLLGHQELSPEVDPLLEPWRIHRRPTFGGFIQT
jgi:hypothetical protein